MVDSVVEPGVVPELECRTHARGNPGKEVLQARQIHFQVGRQLEKQGPELIAQRVKEIKAEGVLAAVEAARATKAATAP